MQNTFSAPDFIPFSDWTTSQRELWPLQELEANGAALNTGEFTEIFGAVDQPAFIRASRQTVEECDALRARFTAHADGPRLSFAPPGDWRPGMLDLTGDADPRARALEWMANELARSLDPAIRVFSWTLICLAPDHFIWCFIVHQMALDGSARNIAARRMADVYSHLAGGDPRTQVPGPSGDLRREDGLYRQSIEYEADRSYWTGQTAQLPVPARLTRKPSGGSYVGARATAPLPEPTAAAIRQMMAKTRVSLSGLFLSLTAMYLNRFTGQHDVVVGMLASARVNAVTRAAPGNISNTLPIRLKLDADMTLQALFAQAASRVREAMPRQRFPLSAIKEALPSLSGELYSIAVNVMKFDTAHTFGAAATATHNLSNGPVDDLTISVFAPPGEGALTIALNGNTARYTSAELQAHYDRLVYFLGEVTTADLSTKISDISFLSAAERERVTQGFNATAQPLPAILLADLFAARVLATPDAVAIVCENAEWTYCELDRRANRLARHLIALGLGAEDVIAVLAHRAPLTIVALLAIWKCGAAYLPLDPDDPVAGLRYRHRVSRAKLWFVDPGLARKLDAVAKSNASEMNGVAPRKIILEEAALAAMLEGYRDDAIAASECVRPVTPENMACLLYPSGSTSAPRGVEISQSALHNRLAWMAETFPLPAGTAILHKAPMGMEIAVWEWALPLLFGGKLVLARPRGERDAAYLREVIRAHGVNLARFSTTLLAAFLRDKEVTECTSLKHIVTSGEPLSGELQTQCLKLLPRAELWSLHGSTELTVDAAAWRCRSEDGEAAPQIGKPIWNNRFYVLDEKLEPVPIGAPGDLYVAGQGLARGYANAPEATAQVFTSCVFAGAQERVYRTGDRATWRPDGALDFLGRTDGLIRVNGLRVVPEEVEALLLHIDSMESASVTTRMVDGATRLIAHIAYKSGSPALSMSVLRAKLEDHLPQALIPAAFIVAEGAAIDLNKNADAQEPPGIAAFLPSEEYAAPRSEREKMLCRVFAEILGAPRVSINDNFFEMGGHSLLAARLVSRVSAEVKTRVPLRIIFENPTAKSLAAYLDANAPSDPRQKSKPLLVLFPGGGALSRDVVNLQTSLAADFTVAMVDYPDWRTQWGDFFNFEKYLANILAQIQWVAEKPQPLRLVGYSFGASIAYAMAIELTRRGYTIERLCLVDGRSPFLYAATSEALATTPNEPAKSLPARCLAFARREKRQRNEQIGRFIGFKAKNRFVRKCLQWIGPTFPADHSGDLLFYVTQFINAVVPMQEIRNWMLQLDEADQKVAAPAVLLRSRDNGDDWPEDLGWLELVADLKIISLPGTHLTMISENNLSGVRAYIVGDGVTGAAPAKRAELAPASVDCKVLA